MPRVIDKSLLYKIRIRFHYINQHASVNQSIACHAGAVVAALGACVVTVHNFSDGLLNPILGYAVSCLGAFLGLRCVTRARVCQGPERVGWLSLAAVSVGATGIWAMHFIAMLGFTIPNQ